MRVAFAFVASAVLTVGACASESATVPRDRLVQEDAVNGFRMAVVDVCLASALSGHPISDLANENGAIAMETDAALMAQAKAQPGDAVWSARKGEDILIRSNSQDCQVTTRGPLTRAALDAVGDALSDPHGFVAETPAEPKGSNIYKRYSKKVGAQTYRVTLAASDAQTWNGTLTATVTPAPPA
jgi:hypothetical protein